MAGLFVGDRSVYLGGTGTEFVQHRRVSGRDRVMEARGGIEPPMRVLQTLALPLGYRATFY